MNAMEDELYLVNDPVHTRGVKCWVAYNMASVKDVFLSLNRRNLYLLRLNNLEIYVLQGAVNGGVGNTHINKLLTAMDIPEVNCHTYRRHEHEVIGGVENIARESQLPKDHDCRLNFVGSAKAMEPHAAVLLTKDHPILSECNIETGILIADNDSSSVCVARAANDHEILKQSDKNHTSKGVVSELYKINEISMAQAIKNILYHAFNHHHDCGTWCGYKSNPESYQLTNIGDGFKDENLFEALKFVFNNLALKSCQFVSGASSNPNESLNAMIPIQIAVAKNDNYLVEEAIENMCPMVLGLFVKRMELDWTTQFPTPQQNVKAERMNRLLVERGRAIISDSELNKMRQKKNRKTDMEQNSEKEFETFMESQQSKDGSAEPAKVPTSDVSLQNNNLATSIEDDVRNFNVMPDLSKSINNFDGERDWDRAQNWLEKLKRTANTRPHVSAFQTAQSHVYGATKYWLRGRSSEVTNWRTFEAAFIRTFIFEETKTNLWTKMQQRKQQTNESINIYSHKKVALCKALRLPFEKTKDQVAVGLLSAEVFAFILSKRNEDEDELFKDVVSYERVSRGRRGKINKRKDGHEKRRNMGKGSEATASSVKCFNCHQRRMKGSCYNCGSTDHLMNNCTQRRRSVRHTLSVSDEAWVEQVPTSQDQGPPRTALILDTTPAKPLVLPIYLEHSDNFKICTSSVVDFVPDEAIPFDCLLGRNFITSRRAKVSFEGNNVNVEVSKNDSNFIDEFENNNSKRVFDIGTGEESWIYQFDPELGQSRVWVFECEERPTKVRKLRSVKRK
ncbi:hypothetical protein ILUMI_21504 [Ignelater luminosus]|uniref:CCHC-type domain-containing protein n=1 Tax=Ignelater luminosus TaxID=2038154 RepID=A0A8K0G3M9_IGNLU|nr:hypothetical protein ILUMI_21504 [Ignelater luminosus]